MAGSPSFRPQRHLDAAGLPRWLGTALLALALTGLAPQGVAQTEQSSYLFGKVHMLTPAGQQIGTSLSLVRRTLKPADNRIVEVVAAIEAGKPVREFTTVFEVTGSKFSIRDEEDSFTGAGELTGKPWEWTGWTYEVEFTGARKGRMKGDDVLGPSGLAVRKSFATPDGTVRMLFTEDLKPISKTAYYILRAKLLPEQK
jgi:hypothetical protein